ncbi:DUF2271 domain-containing protein [Bacillus sp. 03113]|uniref:DUF2271 domain-containing protein n=1 Tax=Bacillus sp. 03113 TaxID=2578211 RepID=UPI0011427C55|nr:DUF2271 domain-containing protein [Bacillus sp. 03113]
MKKVLIPVVGTLGASVIVISGISNFIETDQQPSALVHQVPSTTKKVKMKSDSPVHTEQENTLGLVSINYNLHHLSRLASNQIAIWIEDEQGNYVKSLFATSFTANGGYEKRPESLPEWRKAANWEKAPKELVNKVSHPQQEAGDHTVYWDCTDDSGSSVPNGIYVFKIEGNIEWENRVIYSGKINIGDEKSKSSASAAYIPASAKEKGTLVEHVSADFLPGETMVASKEEVTTQSRGS